MTNVLITGKGTSGSWQIRGVQLGHAIGARVIPNAPDSDIRWADVVVVVKRTAGDLITRIKAAGKPWVYDIVDAYPQPAAGAWNEAKARHWLDTLLAGLQPDAVIWPTLHMKNCARYMRGTVIDHHHRPGIARNPIRTKIETVGYEGGDYLGEWRPALERACKAIGARFVVNPQHLADLDIVVALRGRDHHGWVQEYWKSNVKLANAQGSGTPIIAQIDDGYIEGDSGCVAWVESPHELKRVFDMLETRSMRQEMSTRLFAQARSVEDIGKQYMEFLCALKS